MGKAVGKEQTFFGSKKGSSVAILAKDVSSSADMEGCSLTSVLFFKVNLIKKSPTHLI